MTAGLYMEYVKCKRRGVASKNCTAKAEKKPDKRMKKTKGKENLEPLISTKHKCCKLTAQEPFKGFRMKDGRGVEGMFFKGLRTQCITRGTLSEVNEARRNEDINKIIDIGRVYFQKGKLAIPQKRPGKGVSDCKDYRIPEKSCFDSGESSTESSENFEFSLSPISPPLTHAEADIGTPAKVGHMKECSADEMPFSRRRLNLKKELQTFALKYEAAVGAQILFKLPENGVLEDALTALRKLQKKRQDEELVREGPQLSSEVEFLRDDLEAEDDTLRRNFLMSEEKFWESFVENPLENMFIMNPSEVENADYSSYLTAFDNGDEAMGASVIEIQGGDFQKPVKELTIVTPPIQFYRRNMF